MATTNPYEGTGLLSNAMNNTLQVNAPTTAGKTAQVDTSAYQPGAQQASQAQTATWAPDKASTVQGQLQSVMDAGGPLMDRAKTRSNLDMNSRGLLNSSMATGAAESALYDAAMPIASADANTNAQAGQYNAEATNTTNRFNANASNTLQGQLIDTGFKGASQNAQMTNEALSHDQDASLRSQMANQQTTQQATQQQADIAATGARQQADIGAAAGRQQTDIAAQQKRQESDQAAVLQRQQLDQVFRAQLQSADAGTRVQLQQMQGETQTSLANIEANYKVLMQTNESASNLYQQSLKNISDIMMNKDLDAAAKQAAISQQSSMLGNGLNLIGKVSNLDLGNILTFTNTGPVGNAQPAPDTTRDTQPIGGRFVAPGGVQEAGNGA